MIFRRATVVAPSLEGVSKIANLLAIKYRQANSEYTDLLKIDKTVSIKFVCARCARSHVVHLLASLFQRQMILMMTM